MEFHTTATTRAIWTISNFQIDFFSYLMNSKNIDSQTESTQLLKSLSILQQQILTAFIVVTNIIISIVTI